jgi:hypothetical protein
VADEYIARGMPVTPDRVMLTSGTSEGIELALGALSVRMDDEVRPPATRRKVCWSPPTPFGRPRVGITPPPPLLSGTGHQETSYVQLVALHAARGKHAEPSGPYREKSSLPFLATFMIWNHGDSEAERERRQVSLRSLRKHTLDERPVG